MGTDRQHLTAAERAPFQTLVKLIEHELELAADGRLDELQEAVVETGAYMAGLPAPAPASAQPLALRAEALRGRVIVEVERLRDGVANSRASLRRSHRVARKYAPPLADGYSTTA